MADEVLSQEEIDALLHGVDDGDIETEVEADEAQGDFSSYDLTSQDRIVRGRMPTLELINERFARLTRISLFNLLRRSADVAIGFLLWHCLLANSGYRMVVMNSA